MFVRVLNDPNLARVLAFHSVSPSFAWPMRNHITTMIFCQYSGFFLRADSGKTAAKNATFPLTFSKGFAMMANMLKIRLQRVGRKNDPSFRIVVTDSKNGPKSGKFIEVLGSYNARYGKPSVKGDRVRHWISVGAGVSDTVHNILVSEKVIEGKKINVLPKKSPIKNESAEDSSGGTPSENAQTENGSADDAGASENKSGEAPKEEDAPANESSASESEGSGEEKREA